MPSIRLLLADDIQADLVFSFSFSCREAMAERTARLLNAQAMNLDVHDVSRPIFCFSIFPSVAY